MKHIVFGLLIIAFIYGVVMLVLRINTVIHKYHNVTTISKNISTDISDTSKENGEGISFTYSKKSSIYDCNFRVKKPYKLITWNDGTYGILFFDEEISTNWYKVIKAKRYRHFSLVIEQGHHWEDSCEAKQDLKDFLNSRITFK